MIDTPFLKQPLETFSLSVLSKQEVHNTLGGMHEDATSIGFFAIIMIVSIGYVWKTYNGVPGSTVHEKIQVFKTGEDALPAKALLAIPAISATKLISYGLTR